MRSDIRKLLLSHRLFSGCDADVTADCLIDKKRVMNFKSGETIHFGDASHYVGVLLSGKAAIYSADSERKTLLRFVSPGEIIGVAGLFAEKPPATRIVACGDGKSEMLFVPREAFDNLLDSSCGTVFRNNLLKFLCDKVSFLNSRIDCVTAGTAERRLALFLLSLHPNDEGRVSTGMSMTALAHALDIGRASLYRAFDSLEKDGLITRKGGDVCIISPEKLEEIR